MIIIFILEIIDNLRNAGTGSQNLKLFFLFIFWWNFNSRWLWLFRCGYCWPISIISWFNLILKRKTIFFMTNFHLWRYSIALLRLFKHACCFQIWFASIWHIMLIYICIFKIIHLNFIFFFVRKTSK